MITSKSNNLIKLCNQIKVKKYSRQYGKCLIESFKIVKELSYKNLLETILVTEDKLPAVNNLNCDSIEVISSDIANFLGETITTDGVFAISKIPSCPNIDYTRCLILDHIQDPSNLGAIVRSACAFGFDTILSINSVYPFSSKVIRSSMGMIFNVSYLDVTFEDIIKLKNDNIIEICVADMNGCNVEMFNIDKKKNFALVIGNEGGGVSQQLRDIADYTLSIPMKSEVESLNASVSAGILMYLLK